MKAEDLDLAYSEFCEAMTRVGQEQAELFLARFALLSMISIGDLNQIRKLIKDAAATGAPAAKT